MPELRFPEFNKEGEWEENVLSNITDAIFDGTHQTPNYTENGIPFFSVENIVSGNKNKFISKEDFEIATIKNKPEKGDILLTRIGKIGFSAIVSWDYEFSIYVTLACIKQSKHFNSYYLHSYFQSSTYQKEIFSKSLLNAVPMKINMEELRKTKVLLPPDKEKKEQQKIASCLSSLDEVIAAHTEKLDLLKDYKKGLMQNLFPQEGESIPKYRFPEFNSPLVKVGFADLGDIKIGLTHKPDYISSGVPFLSSKNISNGYIDFTNVQYISREKFESIPESTKPKLGDILFTRVGSNLGNPIVLEQDIEFGIFVSLGAFRVNKKANNFYMKYWMESDLFWKQVNQKVAGGAKDNLNSTWLREFELFIPSITEQHKIASCLSSLDALITAQAEKIEQLKLHKKGLMQGLFPKIND